MPGKIWIKATCLLAVCAALVPIQRLLAQPAPAVEQTVQSDLNLVAQRLTDESAKQEERDEAARRLVSRHTPQALDILRSALVSARSRGAQLASARALADDADPDPSFVVPLFALLGPDRALSEAAAQALSQYKADPEVVSRLITIATARQQPDAVRTAVIKSLGTFLNKRAGDTLIALLRDDESPSIHNAATTALVDLTGLRENGRDVQKWQQWWNANGLKSEADWKVGLLNERASRLGQIEQRYGQLTDEIRAILADQYQVLTDVQKPEMMMRYLHSSEPVIRAVGARQVVEDSINNHTIAASVREQLRKMVGDSSADVRIEVAGALRALNDASALDPLLTQLAQEPQADVRAALTKAIGPIRDLKALPALRKLLQDPSYAVAEAAADAIKELGPQILEKQSAIAGALATELKGVLDSRTLDPASGRLREALVNAMAPLRQSSLLNTFYALLKPSESVPVRRAALKALGELHDPNSVDIIITSLEDADGTVRLEAVDALGRVGSFEHAESLYRVLGNNESDLSVRDRAWRVLEGWFPAAPKEQLVAWADRFASEPSRRLVVLKALAAKQLAAKEDERLAYTRQNIGETLMALNQPTDAAVQFGLALDYWKSKDQRMVTENLIQQLLGALLKSHQYAQAVQFAGKLIQEDKSAQQTVGPTIRTEAERLRDANDLKSVVELIEASRKMAPPLDDRYSHDLDDIESEVRKRMVQDPQPRAPGPQSASSPRLKLPCQIIIG